MNPGKEPAVYISAVTGLLTAIIGVLVAFGVDVSDAQQNAILGCVAAFSTVIVLVGPIIRGFVTPTDKANDHIRMASLQMPGEEPPLIK